MTVRVGINGFGRIGRLGLRAGWSDAAFSITQINDVAGDVECHAHLLEFDSVQGRWDRDIDIEAEHLTIDGNSVHVTSGTSPSQTDWSQIDVVVECSGKFKTSEALAPYFEQGVKKVVVSAPCPDPALNIVYGVNHHLYNPSEHNVVTAASCTTNCLAPVVKVMHESIGIQHGSMTTIHDITNTQTIVDKAHKDLRRARAASESLIPTTTGSAKAITAIFPELTGKLNGLAVRVPLLNASLTDFVFEATRDTDVEEVNGFLQAAADSQLRGILGFETRPLVSIDYRGDKRSSIVDASCTMVIDNRQVKLLAWYDNEWGYVNRMMELTALIAKQL